jgi:splicing factor 3B subunit 1
MREQQLRGEEAELRKKIQEKSKDGSLKVSSNGDSLPKKRGRWDQTVDEQFVPAKKSASGAITPTWEADVSINLLIITTCN